LRKLPFEFSDDVKIPSGKRITLLNR